MKKTFYKWIINLAYRIFSDKIKDELTTDLYLVVDDQTVAVLPLCLNVPRIGETIRYQRRKTNEANFFRVDGVLYGETTAIAHLTGEIIKTEPF